MINQDDETSLLLGDGYANRNGIDHDGKFIQPDHGSYHATDRQQSQPYMVNSEDLGNAAAATESGGGFHSESLQALDSPTSVAINICQEQVIKPYRRLLLLVGWSPVFEDADHTWKKVCNIFHPLLVMCLVLLGYIIQYSCCFRRDSAGLNHGWKDLQPSRPISSNTTAAVTQPHISCQNVAISQYLIPDILHSAAYLYSFYILRFKQTENLTSLITRSFLQSSLTQRGFWSQGRLIRIMRISVYLSVLWVLLSITSQIIHVVAMYSTISFEWFHTPESAVFAKVCLIMFMLVSFVALDVVYVLVVLNYCVQCLLLIFYTEGLQEKIKRREFELKRAMQEIAEVSDHLQVLNYDTGIALSIVLFNFGTMAVLGFITMFSPHTWENATLLLISTGLSVFFWITIMCIPFVQAARVSAACNSLRKVGHEVRAKAFAYERVAPEELDSFLLFTTSLNMRAKIFLVPIRTSYVAFVSVGTAFVILLLFQMEIIDLHIIH